MASQTSNLPVSNDFVLNEARRKVSDLSGEDLQRELLARVMVQNYGLEIQTKLLTSIKNANAFFVIMYILGFLSALFLFGK